MDKNRQIEIIIREQIEKLHLPLSVWVSNKIFKVSDKVFHNIYARQLKSNDFSIISNNCWGGILYEHFGLMKLSPTIGTYFFADEYLMFIKNLKHYLSCELYFIEQKDSKYAVLFPFKKQKQAIIGTLDDVEIVFLHYKTKEEVKEKWNRRIKRINWDNLIVKFSEQNLCEEKHLREFEELNFKKKILFTKQVYKGLDSISLPFYKNCVQLLSDIHEYRFAMPKIMKIINS